ncbi:transglutaminase-like cysteine peptidase [Kordiimonas marina]|uniref:transglutaminase-like cysteine peptidase n=1 Tax=Kordiimonas marina TaxID=2872312 RepID=UPI001FF22813|nr:transglutaminase-like cysteine peptidase [Kordiimonas marina]MCJ9428233.1 transglutaminase-like cysteine peptidase [Kordiimonas marina]
MALLFFAASPLHAAPVPMKLFGSREIMSTNMKAFTKWSDMWRKYNLPRTADQPQTSLPPQNEGAELKCAGLERIACGRKAWNSLIEAQKGKPEREQLDAVNLYMNKSPYIIDPVNWGVPDYWETPDEFFLKDGDCEDYAISKYITLKRLGVDPDTMRLVIVQDENLRAAHAILAVALKGVTYILDNQVNTVLPDTQILHYRPVYSINESAWWLHQVRRFSH